MSRKSFVRIIAALLIVGVLLGLAPLSAWAAPPSPAPPAPAPGYPIYHVVQPGENLYRISLRYGTTVWAIAQANGIWDVNRIRSYQVLRIPGPGPHPGPGPGPGPGPKPKTYIVQPGETLSSIAWKFGVSVWALASANGIWNHNLIYAYQRLYIP